MLQILSYRFGERCIFALLFLSVLWRGGKGLEATWLLAGLAVFLGIIELWQWWKQPSKDAKRTPVPLTLWGLLLLFVLLTILSFLFSSAKNYGLDEVMQTASLVFLFLWVIRRKGQPGQEAFEKSTLHTIVAAAFLACLIGIAVYIFQPVDRFVGTFFDMRFHTDYWPNAWAEFTLLAWPMSVLLAYRQKSEKIRVALAGVIALLFASLLLSYSRGAILACIGQVVVMSVLFLAAPFFDSRFRGNLIHGLKKISLYAIGIIVTGVLLFLAVNAVRSQLFPVQSVAKKVTFTASEGTSSINERSDFWKQAIELTKERPLLGWGPYSFRFVQPQYMNGVLATSDHPHNVFLKLAMERGILASLVFLAIIAIVLLFSLRPFPLSILTFTAFLGLIAHNLIDYNLQFVGINLTGTLLLALLYRNTPSVKPAPASAMRRRLMMCFVRVEAFLLLLLLVVTLSEGVFLVTSSLGRHAQARHDKAAALDWYEKSTNELFSRDLFLSMAELYRRSGDPASALQAMQTYGRLNPYDPRGWKMKGEIHLNEGNLKAAQQELTKAFETGKYTDTGIFLLYVEAMVKGSSIEALTAQKQEIDAIFRAYSEAIERNAHFIALSHAPEDLLVLARLLEKTFRDDTENYVLQARTALSHAREEREKYTARQMGILW